MIYHASMRTDIPAFYSQWFFNRIREGWFLVRNPYNDQSVTRHSLDREVTDLLMFCTKNPEPMLDSVHLLRDYRQSWNVTITPYRSDLEPNVPDKRDVIHSVIYLSRLIGAERIAWRYDPVIITDRYTTDFHIHAFSQMCQQLKNAVSSVIISFVEIYPKLRTLAPFIREVSSNDKRIIIENFSEITKRHNLKLKLCAEPHIYDPNMIDQSGCETHDGIESKVGYRIRLPNVKPKRSHCQCYLGLDMGAYNSCPHLCRYCYANSHVAEVTAAFAAHNPDSPILTGSIPNESKDNKWYINSKDVSWKIDGVLF